MHQLIFNAGGKFRPKYNSNRKKQRISLEKGCLQFSGLSIILRINWNFWSFFDKRREKNKRRTTYDVIDHIGRYDLQKRGQMTCVSFYIDLKMSVNQSFFVSYGMISLNYRFRSIYFLKNFFKFALLPCFPYFL